MEDHSTGHDQQEEEVEDDARGSTKRSYYGCKFCKRGFTNAQALGGHMNIHRKDRSVMKKTKQEVKENSSINAPIKVSNDESIMKPSPFLSEISVQLQPTRYYSSTFDAMKKKNLYNPRNPSSYAFQNEFLNPRSQLLNVNQEFLSSNLSLQIGPTLVDDNGDRRRVTQEDGEVDLELRLGHVPY